MKPIDKQRFDNMVKDCEGNFDDLVDLAFVWYRQSLELQEDCIYLQKELDKTNSDLLLAKTDY